MCYRMMIISKRILPSQVLRREMGEEGNLKISLHRYN